MHFETLGQVICEGISQVCDYGRVSTICSWRPIYKPRLRVTPREDNIVVTITDTWMTVFAIMEIQEAALIKSMASFNPAIGRWP